MFLFPSLKSSELYPPAPTFHTAFPYPLLPVVEEESVVGADPVASPVPDLSPVHAPQRFEPFRTFLGVQPPGGVDAHTLYPLSATVNGSGSSAVSNVWQYAVSNVWQGMAVNYRPLGPWKGLNCSAQPLRRRRS